MEKIADFLGSEKGFRTILRAFGVITLIIGLANTGLLIISAACFIAAANLNNND